MSREAESKPRQRRAYVCSQSNRTERCVGDELRGCYPARRGPCHLYPARCRGGLDQGPERRDRGQQHHGLQGEHGGHLRPGRFVRATATHNVLPRLSSRGFVLVACFANHGFRYAWTAGTGKRCSASLAAERPTLWSRPRAKSTPLRRWASRSYNIGPEIREE